MLITAKYTRTLCVEAVEWPPW